MQEDPDLWVPGRHGVRRVMIRGMSAHARRKRDAQPVINAVMAGPAAGRAAQQRPRLRFGDPRGQVLAGPVVVECPVTHGDVEAQPGFEQVGAAAAERAGSGPDARPAEATRYAGQITSLTVKLSATRINPR